MKKHIRAALEELRRTSKPKKNTVVPQDLDNQILSKDPAQKVRQLDYQAQKSEERQTLS
jgi:hypothetical protein